MLLPAPSPRPRSPAADSSRASSIMSPASDDRSSSLSTPRELASVDGDALVRPMPAPCRRNEHLAVLIPRHLWKPDHLAARCDKYACRLKFSLFERKHHCRKCGGIYCHACSARTTPLLDTTKLPFLLPPKGTPITHFAAPNAPVLDARVCDDCHNQIHGVPSPRLVPASPQPVAPLAASTSSLSTLSPSTPPDDRPLFPRSASATAIPRHRPPYWPDPPIVKPTKLEGDLDRYPLKDPSATCKAAGGGRWEPKRYTPRWDGRLPDGRLRYEVEAERMEEAARRRRANPVIIDGEIRVRKSRAPPPPPRTGPYKLPTF
ncbi:hypothetical protein K439DRAFT_1646740 [Ramaria rubella]|nr:hypothetical protein K439DRAFT_1646740 [Ramaria rubella]